MNKLVAIFDVQLPFRLLVNRSEDDKLIYEIQIDDFDVKLHLIREKHSTFVISKTQISVARDESFVPPTDYTDQTDYFEIRLPEYQKAALTVLNRLILFFKYRLHNPLLHELNEDYLLNPKWTNESGEKVGEGVQRFIIPLMPISSFNVKNLTASDDDALTQALKNPIVPELHEEILSDAQAAIFQKNLRRAILEMAIACEVAIKQAFFKRYSVAGAAYEYLEDKRKINVTIPELIHGVAKEAFGESFKDVNNEAYENIDYLFRCRNKIAHRGEIIYKDDSGAVHTVNYRDIEKWWESVEMLFDWLNKHRLQ